MTPVLVAIVALLGAANAALFPLPAQLSTGTGTAYLTPSFGFFCAAGGVCSDTLKAAMARYLNLVPSGSSSPSAALSECSIYVSNADETLNAKTDESYNIVIHAGDCYIGAGTVYGAIHGLETLSQMFVGRSIANVPISITDQPRFAFRALMIDTSRHFLPVPFIEHIIDTMVMSKLNVLHWHIVDSNSFPCGSRTFPELAEKGAYDPQAIYTTQQMGAIVAYAQQRGVRIIPEWDVPGHGSWGAGIPSLMGCSDVLDPTQNATYSFLVSFFQEMETIFIDDYIFLGGDEVDHTCWDQNPAIAAWLKSHSMTSSQLEQYFWQRVSSDVLPKLKKTLGVWEADNIQVDLANLPPGSYGNAYQSQSTLAKITTAGYNAVLSGPWYLDQENPAGCHEYAWQEVWQCMYNVEPLQGLTPAQSALVLGGEICMWAEGVNDKNFDSRTWDRSAAVGERLWSPANVQINTNNTQSRLMEHICRMDQRGVRASPIAPNFCPTDETFLDTRIKQLEQELALLRSKQ